MTDIAKLRILVDLDSSGVLSGAAASTLAVTGFERATTNALSNVTRAFSNLTTSQKTLAGVGAAAVLVGTALQATVAPAIQFESAFAGVEKTVSGTPAQLTAIRDGLLDLSATIPTAAEDLADIAANAGQLGVEAPKVLAFTETVALLGETTDLDFDSAAQSLARFLNVTGNDASIQQIGDVIVELGNNSATTESQIVTFATRLASALTVAGASEDEILALGAAFSSLGVEAEAGSSALSRVITQIADAARLGGSDLRVFAEVAGVTTEQFADLARNAPIEAFVLFSEGLGQVSAEGRSITPILKELDLQGIRTTRVMQLAALGSDQLRDSLGLAADQFVNGGAAAEEASRRFETTESRLAVLEGRLRRVAIEAGTPALGIFARGADEAGDAVERLAEIIGPIAGELADLFAGAAVEVGGFVAAVSSPLLNLGIGGLETTAGILGDILSILNSFDTRLLIFAALAADIALVGPVSVTAAAGLRAVGLQGTFAASGVRSLSSVTSTLALGAVVAGLVIFGDELETIGQKARAAGAEYRDTLGQDIGSVDFDTASAKVRELQDRMEELRSIDGVIDPSISERLVNIVRATDQFNGENVFELRGELEELERVLAETQHDEYVTGIERIADRLGISTGAAEEAVNRLGLVDDTVALGSLSNIEYANSTGTVIDALREANSATIQLADGNTFLIDKIFSGNGALSDFAFLLGVSEAELGRLVARIDDVTIGDLLSGDTDKIERALDLIGGLIGEYEIMASQIGITSSEYESQITIVDNLASSHSALRQAIDGAKNALALMEAQERAVEEASIAFGDALDSIGEVGGLEAAADAMQTLSLEIAGSGVSAAEAAQRQRDLYRSFLDAAIAAGVAEDEAIAVALALGLVPEAILSEITVDGQRAKEEVDRHEAQVAALERNIRVDLSGDPSDLFAELNRVDARIGEFTAGDYVAFLEANGVPAEEAIILAGSLATGFSRAEYSATLDADGRPAGQEIASTQRQADDYDKAYVAFLEANGFSAQAAINLATGRATEYSRGTYNASLTANDLATPKIEAVKFNAREINRPYRASLEASDFASDVIRGASSELNSFRDRNITLTASYTRSGFGGGGGGGGTQRRYGGITAFNDGGMSVANDVIRAGVVETPGAADIYAPATPYRVFAEPVTGGETYIPHQGDRVRNRNIWERHGQMFGFMADGGIMSNINTFQTGGITSFAGGSPNSQQISISAPINVDLSAVPGCSPDQVAIIIEAKLRECFDRMTRTILNVS